LDQMVALQALSFRVLVVHRHILPVRSQIQHGSFLEIKSGLEPGLSSPIRPTISQPVSAAKERQKQGKARGVLAGKLLQQVSPTILLPQLLGDPILEIPLQSHGVRHSVSKVQSKTAIGTSSPSVFREWPSIPGRSPV
jgi:hypothetical protein